MRTYEVQARMTSHQGDVIRGATEEETAGQAVDQVLERFGVTPDEVEYIVIHAVGIRIVLGDENGGEEHTGDKP